MSVDTDAGPFQACSWGVGTPGATFHSADQHSAPAAVTNAPATVTNPNGAVLVILDLEVSVDTAMTVTFTEETTGTVVAIGYLPANCGWIQLTPRGKRQLYTAGKRLMVQTSVAGNISVNAHYYTQPL